MTFSFWRYLLFYFSIRQNILCPYYVVVSQIISTVTVFEFSINGHSNYTQHKPTVTTVTSSSAIAKRQCCRVRLVMAKSKRLDLGDNILGTLWLIFNQCDVISQQSNRIQWKKCKIRAITPFKVIQGHRGRYQSKARIFCSLVCWAKVNFCSETVSVYQWCVTYLCLYVYNVTWKCLFVWKIWCVYW